MKLARKTLAGGLDAEDLRIEIGGCRMGERVMKEISLPETAKTPTRSASRLNRLLDRCVRRRYLEIGVATGSTFFHVDAEIKTAVDPHFRFSYRDYVSPNVAFHEITSDAFFIGVDAGTAYDLIYIDGLHEFRQALRDFCNSLSTSHSDTIWLIDDTVPSDVYSVLPSPQEAVRTRRCLGLKSRAWHGDTYKVIFAIHDLFPRFSYCTIVGSGNPQTIVWQESRADFAPYFASIEAIERVDYFEFMKLRPRIMNEVNEVTGLTRPLTKTTSLSTSTVADPTEP
jgi:hypothetical protein